MELNYFKDCLFDCINESEALNVTEIEADEKNDSFLITVQDGNRFEVICRQAA